MTISVQLFFTEQILPNLFVPSTFHDPNTSDNVRIVFETRTGGEGRKKERQKNVCAYGTEIFCLVAGSER